jgi:hypothetical protein
MWNKYLSNSCVYLVKHKPYDSALWSDMLQVRDIYLSGRSMEVNNGEITHFWGDAWWGSTPFKDKYPLLFNLCSEIDITMAKAARRNWFFTYRRWLSADVLVLWEIGWAESFNLRRMTPLCGIGLRVGNSLSNLCIKIYPKLVLTYLSNIYGRPRSP